MAQTEDWRWTSLIALVASIWWFNAGIWLGRGNTATALIQMLPAIFYTWSLVMSLKRMQIRG